MAVLDHIEVTVQVDGQDLQEYVDEDSDRSDVSVSKYIEAISGARFVIAATISTLHKFLSDALGMEVALDGTIVKKALFLERQRDKNLGHHRVFEGVVTFRDDQWKIRPFTFREVNTVEEPLAGAYVESRHDDNANLGTICVKIFDKKVIGTSAARGWSDEELLPTRNVTEKEIKRRDVTHAVALGDIQSARPLDSYRAEYFDGEDAPIAVFTFKYRSRKALQSLQLLPKDPSPDRPATPIPLEERQFETLTPEEKDELVNRHQARYQNERSANVKRESRVEFAPGFKRERDEEVEELIASSTAKKVKTRPFMHGEIVELD